MIKSSETKSTYIEMLPGNIFCISVKDAAEIDLAEAKAWIRTTNAMMDKTFLYRGGIYDVSLIAKINEDAQTYLRSGEDLIGTVVGVGIISTSVMGRMLGNIFVDMSPTRAYPVKFFDSPIRAEHWIRSEMKATQEKEAR